MVRHILLVWILLTSTCLAFVLPRQLVEALVVSTENRQIEDSSAEEDSDPTETGASDETDLTLLGGMLVHHVQYSWQTLVPSDPSRIAVSRGPPPREHLYAVC